MLSTMLLAGLATTARSHASSEPYYPSGNQAGSTHPSPLDSGGAAAAGPMKESMETMVDGRGSAAARLHPSQ
jgi:hypothetical protein